jgi:hypothetical protein
MVRRMGVLKANVPLTFKYEFELLAKECGMTLDAAFIEACTQWAIRHKDNFKVEEGGEIYKQLEEAKLAKVLDALHTIRAQR